MRFNQLDRGDANDVDAGVRFEFDSERRGGRRAARPYVQSHRDFHYPNYASTSSSGGESSETSSYRSETGRTSRGFTARTSGTGLFAATADPDQRAAIEIELQQINRHQLPQATSSSSSSRTGSQTASAL